MSDTLGRKDGFMPHANVDEIGVSYGIPRAEGAGNVISTVNSRDASTLLPNAIFQGVGEDVSGYGRAGVSITTTNKSSGILTIEVSRDNITWGGPTRTWADTRFAQPHMWNIVEKYFRIKYTNGTTEARGLTIQVQYSNNADILLGHQLDETLIDETEAIATRSVLVGRDVDGIYQNIATNLQAELKTEANDPGITQLMTEVLKELKIMNIYNSIKTDNIVTRKDVEV